MKKQIIGILSFLLISTNSLIVNADMVANDSISNDNQTSNVTPYLIESKINKPYRFKSKNITINIKNTNKEKSKICNT